MLSTHIIALSLVVNIDFVTDTLFCYGYIAGTYSHHDVGSNLSMLTGMSADPWPQSLNVMTAAGHHTTSHHGVLSNTSPAQTHAAHAQYMWNLAAPAATNQSCAVSQYFRSGGYALPPPETPTSLGVNPAISSVDHTSPTTPTYDTHVQFLAQPTDAAAGFHRNPVAWRPLSPSGSGPFKVENCNM